MEEETQESKTLDCSKSDEFPTKAETPLSETTEIENPLTDFPNSDKIQGLSSKVQGIEVSKIVGSDKTLAKEENPIPETIESKNPLLDSCQSGEITGGCLNTVENSIGEVGGNIDDTHIIKTLENPTAEDAQMAKTLGNSIEEGEGKIDDAEVAKTLEECSKEDDYDDDEDGFTLGELLETCVDDSNKRGVEEEFGIGCCSSERKNTKFGRMFGPASDSLSKGCNCHQCSGSQEEVDDDERMFMSGYPCHGFPHSGHHDHYCRNPHFRRRHGMRHHPHTMTDDELYFYHNNRMRYGHMGRRHYFMDGRPDLMDGRHSCMCGNHGCMGRSDFQGREADRLPLSGPRSYEPKPEPEPEPELCPVGAGLRNLGNTCFMNAILQCFTHTVPFVEGLQSVKHEASSHGESEFCVLCAVRNQIEHSLAYSGRVLSPSNLVDNLSHISTHFSRFQQEDAHEFLQALLDKLDCNWSKYEPNATDSSSDGSLVQKVFGGRTVSQIRCCKCGHSSDTYELLIDLSLEIEDVDSLRGAFESFTKVENLVDTEKFTCSSCKEQVQVKKQLLLDQAPAVAALHLKRFKSDGVRIEKIDKMIKYPLELDLVPFTKGAVDGNEDLKYELLGFVVHVGHWATSGHYFCYIRTSPDEWYLFDDSKVTRVSEATALDQDAYILFYARKGTSWFSSLVEEWKARADKTSSPKSVLDSTDLPSSSNHPGVSLHGCEAAEKRDAAGDTCAKPSSAVRHGAVETRAGTAAQDSAVADRSSASPSSMAIHDDVLADKAKLDVQLVRATNDCYKSSPCLSYGEGDVKGNQKGEIGRFSMERCPLSNVENNLVGLPGNDVDVNPSTPPRPESPDIYTDNEPAELTYRIPINHLEVGGRASSGKKSIDKAKNDLKRKEAAKYINKSMPSGRRHFFMAAMNASLTDSSPSRKRKKQSSLLNKHTPRKRGRISPKRVLPMAASV